MHAGGSALTGQGAPPIPRLRMVSARCCVTPPLLYLLDGGARGLVGVPPSLHWMRVGSARCRVRGISPPPSLVATHIRRALTFGGSPLPVRILRLAACEERALPVLVPCLHLPHIRSPCPHGGLMDFPTSGSPASSSSASKPYPRRASTPFLGLAPSAQLGCLCVLTSLPLPATLTRCGIGGATGPILLDISLLPLLSPLAFVSRVAGEFPSPPRPP